MLIDTHCHLDFESYHDDLAEVIRRAADAGVTRIINPATDVQTGADALGLSAKYPNVYVAVGIHPNSTANYADDEMRAVEAQANHPKVVAIGDNGPDDYRDLSAID